MVRIKASLFRLNVLEFSVIRVTIGGDNRVIIEKNNFSIVTFIRDSAFLIQVSRFI